MNPSLSFIYPHINRTELFRANLESLCRQTDLDFEIVTVDNSEDPAPWIELVKEFRDRGLKITAVTIDLFKCVHFKQYHDGLANPAASQNLGVRLAKGNIVTLSSPEVINATTNVANIKSHFSVQSNSNDFLYGWIDEKHLGEVKHLIIRGISNSEIRGLFGPYVHHKSGAKCRSEYFPEYAYYLGSMLKDKFVELGGINEKYMAALANEDDEFACRVRLKGMRKILSESVSGIHLSHERKWFKHTADNRALWKTFDPKKDVVANKNHEWGSISYIKNQY